MILKKNFEITSNNIINLYSEKPSYSSSTMLFAFLIFSIAPNCYAHLKGYINLPSTDYVRRLEGKLNVSPDTATGNDVYIAKVRSNIEKTPRNKHVILAFDEIYIEQNLMRCGNNHVGFADDGSGELATRILAVMIICPFSNYRDVYALYKVSGILRC